MNDFAQMIRIPEQKTSLSYLNQAGFILKTKSGETIGVDLYLTDCVERFDGFKRLSPKVAAPEELFLDYVVASHWHLDHFDIDAMPFLMANGKTRLICAEDCKDHVAHLHLDESRVSYIKAGETLQCGDITLHAVFCDHGTGAPLAVGFVFELDGYKVYSAGDTCLRIDKADDIKEMGPFDVMIAPINGAYGNLNEQDNVVLSAFLQPKLSIPCHFWTFAEHHGDPGLWMQLIKEQLPGQKYRLMAPGEQIYFDEI